MSASAPALPGDREPQRIVIVGAGHAGTECAFALRSQGFAGDVTLINGESISPYQRPPLSKTFIKDRAQQVSYLRSVEIYERNKIRLVSGEVRSIDRAGQTIVLTDGQIIPYDQLVLATGTEPNIPKFAGPDLQFASLIDFASADQLREKLANAERFVVIGAGFVGLEFAAVAAELGKKLTVVDLADRVLARVATSEISDFFQSQHLKRGVSFQFGTSVTSVKRETDGSYAVQLSNGSLVAADIVLVAVGVKPNVKLAQAAGLEVRRGIVVDARLATSDPKISAIGDCAEAPSPYADGHICLASVQNAVDQAKQLASFLHAKTTPVARVPWFWSDQGKDKLQIAGLILQQADHVVRGSVEAGAFSVFSISEGKLHSVQSVNRAADHMLARRLIAAGCTISPRQAGDPNFDLRTL
jgi:3-phenylpropionate/trans-cinnamate dioxygenase ferredoxin reductase subunit